MSKNSTSACAGSKDTRVSFYCKHNLLVTSFSRCTPRPRPSMSAGFWSSPPACSWAPPPPRCPGASGYAWATTKTTTWRSAWSMHSRLDLMHSRLDLMYSRLDLMHSRLDLMLSRLDLMHSRLDWCTASLIWCTADLIWCTADLIWCTADFIWCNNNSRWELAELQRQQRQVIFDWRSTKLIF